jgi:aspartyl-tRNA(Asn)/glutamyl-tRNA(Gln) amidotransferase subunit A
MSVQSRLEQSLENIQRFNPALNAMLSVKAQDERICAAEIDHAQAQGQWCGLLAGLTVSLKDNIDWVGTPTTAATVSLKDNFPQSNAFIVNRLIKEGAVLTGKANLHEWVFGPTSQSQHFGPVKNLWDIGCFAGGSSGGSGAAVAADMCAVSIGSDTAGSIRIPAAFNGLVGLRPTIGRISRSGSVAVSARFDTLGPLARRVSDVARTFVAIAGHDPSDAFSVDRPVTDVMRRLNDPVKGLRIGVMRRWFFDDIDVDLRASLEKAIGIYRDLGVEVVEVDVGDVENAQQMLGFRIVLADGYAVHQEQLRQRREDYGQDLLIRFDLGQAVTGAQYADALHWIEGFSQRLETVWQSVDALLHPTVPFAAPQVQGMDYAKAIRAIPKFTCVYASAGFPATALPCGFTAQGMPLSMELAAPPFAEETLLRLGHAYQGVTNHHLQKAPLLCSN